MNRAQYMKALAGELKYLGVSDIEDILDEYHEHFDCRMDEDYSEEEIAAKLGDPREMARQFADHAALRGRGHGLTALERTLADVGVALACVVGAAQGVVLAAFGLCCLAAGLQLALNARWISLIPAMPRLSGMMLGLSLLVLALIMLLVCAWYARLMGQCLRAYGCVRRNEAVKMLRVRCPGMLRVLVITFLLLFTATFIVAAVQAGRIEFWHAWGWFRGA